MTLKIISSASDGNYAFVSDDNQNFKPQTNEKTANHQPFPGKTVLVKGIQKEDPRELQRRLLLEAASQAGIDDTDEQKQFVEKFLTGISFTDDTSDPSPQDDKSVKSADIKNESVDYKLSKEEISALRALQTAYLKRGGKLHAGKVYDYSSEGRQLSAGEIRNGRRGMTAEQYEQWKTREEFRKAEILPTAFGTPSKLQDLKHVVIKIPPGAAADADGILRTYIGERYGGGNLWADKLDEIRDLAKQSGVKLENVTSRGGTAEFDISVGNLLKLHQTYISVQANFNAAEKIAQTAQDKMALNQFLIGVGEGAWNDLKANYQMVRHPLETINNIREAISTLANLDQEQLLKIYENLKAQGKEFIFEKDVSEVSRDVGKVVGTALVEFALAKGIGAGLKCLQGITETAAFLQKANQLKQTIGKLPIPTAAIKIVDFGNGLKMPMARGELKKLEDIVNLMKSSDESLQMLKGGSTAGREVLTEVAEKGLSEISQSGLKSLRGLISKEGLLKAKEQLITLGVGRTELIARFENLIKNSSLSQKALADIRAARNSLLDHLTQEDLVGALRDNLGKAVRQSGNGKTYNHIGEVEDALNSLKESRRTITTKDMRNLLKDSQEYKILSQEADAINEVVRRTENFLDIK